ncbi:hypothetical protein D9M71_425570 [compost metagenome]
MAHGRRQVGRTDEHAVDAVNRGDGVEVFQALEAFHLDQQAHLLVGLGQVGGDVVPARRARQRGTDATDALGRIVHGAHQLLGLLGRLDHRHQQGLRADVEQLLDHHRVADRRPDHRLAGVGRDGLQLAEQAAQVVGRVLAVEQQPVETGVGGQLGAVRIGQADPQADLLFGAQALLEGVDGHLHRLFLRRSGRRWSPACRSRHGRCRQPWRPPDG